MSPNIFTGFKSAIFLSSSLCSIISEAALVVGGEPAAAYVIANSSAVPSLGMASNGRVYECMASASASSRADRWPHGGRRPSSSRSPCRAHDTTSDLRLYVVKAPEPAHDEASARGNETHVFDLGEKGGGCASPLSNVYRVVGPASLDYRFMVFSVLRRQRIYHLDRDCDWSNQSPDDFASRLVEPVISYAADAGKRTVLVAHLGNHYSTVNVDFHHVKDIERVGRLYIISNNMIQPLRAKVKGNCQSEYASVKRLIDHVSLVDARN